MNTLPLSARGPAAHPPAGRFKRGLLALSLMLATTAAWSQESAPDADLQAGNSGLEAPLFYQLLLGELKVSTGEPGAGYSLILDAARKQASPDLFRRAVEIALQARSGDAALTAARAWSQTIPSSPDADRFELQILLALNRVKETGPALRRLLEQAPAETRSQAVAAIPQLFGRVADKAAALVVVKETLAPYLKQPTLAADAWTSVGRMEWLNQQKTQALASARQAHAADPASDAAALLAMELMEGGVSEAEPLVRSHLRNKPPSADAPSRVALAYARVLFDLQRNADARALLEQLTQVQPGAMEPWLLLATLQVQDRRLSEAQRSLQTFMGLARQSTSDHASQGLTQAYLLMAQISEKQNDFESANAWLDRIENEQDVMAAQMRRASLLARQGKMAQARSLLRNQTERRPEDARLKLMAEAQLLREFKQWQQAYDVFAEAVERFPEDADLIYDQAMMAEKINRLDDMERLFRQVIALEPEHHHAYNALGYSLADRGLRLADARKLIEKAASMAPDDAYIQDSLGWVEFRMGNMPKALGILQTAYQKRPDAEIAAHLGEVLWVSGERERALQIWREGMLLSSDNETLLGTLQRLQVKP